jgi:hypothetical protein
VHAWDTQNKVRWCLKTDSQVQQDTSRAHTASCAYR